MATKKPEVEEKAAIAVPAYLQNKVATTSGDDVDSLASASLSIPRISLKGKKFKVILDGEEVQKPSQTLDVVILAVEPGPGLFIKTYYGGTYNPNDTSPPVCASSNGVAPDAWVTNPQSDRCNSCQQNVFGSATAVTSGKKAKACKDSKRMWVALPDDLEGTVFALGVPVTSLKAVSKYAKELKDHNYPMTATITRLSMNEDSDFPELQFEVAGFLSEEDFEIAEGRNAAKNWDIGASSKAPMLEQREAPKELPNMASVIEGSATVDAPEKAVQEGVDKW